MVGKADGDRRWPPVRAAAREDSEREKKRVEMAPER